MSVEDEAHRATAAAVSSLGPQQLRVICGLLADEIEVGFGDTLVKVKENHYATSTGKHLHYRASNNRWIFGSSPDAVADGAPETSPTATPTSSKSERTKTVADFSIRAPHDIAVAAEDVPLPAGLRTWTAREEDDDVLPRELVLAVGPAAAFPANRVRVSEVVMGGGGGDGWRCTVVVVVVLGCPLQFAAAHLADVLDEMN